MSSLSLLVTEFQSLSSETRRKHPDVREAAEKAIVILKALSSQGTPLEDGPQSEDLLRPVFMGCATKNAKVTSIALGSLQRLIALHAVPPSAVQSIIDTMNDCMSQGVDIQLRILQTLLSLITNFTSIHGPLLAEALLLCFKLQESRIAVVSSTAAATLRQLVMFVIDKVVDEDRKDEEPTSRFTEIALPDGTHRSLRPSALDAYAIVEDLCLLTNSEKPHFLNLGSLPKTFALELIESVLTNYHALFRQHDELIVLIQHHLCPLLLRLLSDKPHFPLTLRAIRVVFLLLKQFSEELPTEGEVFLSLLIKVIGGDSESGSADGHPRPHWMRVLSMEIIRGLCSDALLMRRVWQQYDAQEGSSNLFGSLVSVLKRLVTEKPALLGVSAQMFGVGVTSHHTESGSAASSGYGFDVGTVAGLVANAASATVTGVVGMMGTEHGISVANSAMKLQCIDQLDKADTPVIPESYIYLLGLQCLVSISEGFAAATVPVFNTVVVQRQRASGETSIKAPPALDIESLPEDASSTQQVKAVYGMLENGWPALLAALSFLIATNLSDELFGDVLQAYQNLTNVAGMLGLTTPRDAFLTSLAKFSIPARVVASIDAIEPATPKSALQEGFNAISGATPPPPPGLSERNMACLKVLISSALFLAGSLGPAWYHIFETLQNADYVLSTRTLKGMPKKVPTASGAPSVTRVASNTAALPPGQDIGVQQRHVLLNDIDGESILRTIQRLFDSSKNLDDPAFTSFVTALCRLGAEMVEMQSGEEHAELETDAMESTLTLAPVASSEVAHRRRASGIHLSRTLRSGDFSINKLGSISRMNILRFTSRSPDVAWTIVMGHLVAVVRNRVAPHALRLQAARTLDDILLVVPRNIGSSEERRRSVQQLMFDVLAEQVAPDHHSGNTITIVEIRKMGLETLHQILQSAGHTLLVGWETMFNMLGEVCSPSYTVASASQSAATSPTLSPRHSRPLSLNLAPQDRAGTTLVRIAFMSLTLVCDSLSTLSPEHLRLCISTIGKFGRQADTNIALTAAGSLLWGVSDSIQSRRKESDEEEQYNTLWMLLLLEVLGLCTDSRSEVRVGAIQTLFRTLQLYGSTLSPETWDECIWKVIFPLLDAITETMSQLPRTSISAAESSSALGMPPDASQAWDESKTLALGSIGSIFSEFLKSKVIHLESFSKIWDTFVGHIQTSFNLDYGSSCTASLRCLEKSIKAINGDEDNLSGVVHDMWQRVWKACVEMGQLVQSRARPPLAKPNDETLKLAPFDQDSLLALVDVLKATREVSRRAEGHEWDLEQLSKLMAVLKGIITYPDSPVYKSDIDALTPVQSAVVELIKNVDVSISSAPSLIMRDLSELLTLPYLGAFDVSGASSTRETSRQSKRVTYIGLTKVVMPILLDLFLRFKDDAIIYSDTTLETVLSAFSVPIKLKYECPDASKNGKDEPLWKTATVSFLRLLKECTITLHDTEKGIPDQRIEGIWRQIIDVFTGGILADCRIAENMPLEEQEAEELFDLSLLSALEIDVVPYIADSRVPDYVVIQLAKTLYNGSQVYVSEDEAVHDNSASLHSKTSSDLSISTKVDELTNSTLYSKALPRERFSYWCFDLLALICSDTLSDEEKLRRRLAALSLPVLLKRCRATLLSYLADDAVRGNYPLPRVREEELVYVLNKLVTLRLWPGSLWAALSDEPSKYCIEQPGMKAGLPLADVFSEARKRSTRAHIFELYTPLCRIAALPRKTPTAWTRSFKTTWNEEVQSRKVSLVAENATIERTTQLDARELALSCLEELGKEICPK